MNTPLLIVMIYGAIGHFDHVRATVHHEHGFAILVVGEVNAGRHWNFVRQQVNSGTNAWVVFVDQRTFVKGLARRRSSNASSRELLDGVVRC